MRDKVKRIYLIKASPRRLRIYRHENIVTDKRLFDEPLFLGKPESQAPDAIKRVYHGRHLIRLYLAEGFYVGAKSPVCLECPEASSY